MLRYTQEEPVTEVEEKAEELYPPVPETLEETGLSEVLIEDLLLKMLLGRGVLTGREMADAICLPFKLLVPILAELKSRMFVTHRTTAALGDFYYTLTEQGKQTAMFAKEYSGYVGPAPVVFEEYLASVQAQSIRHEVPTMADLRRAFADIVLEEAILETLGPAINSGRGIFLFGEPGNGKTTIAERIRDCFGGHLYIPHTIWIEGEIVQLYDPQTHEPLPLVEGQEIDNRWVKVKRPTVIVGGELMMESLDIKYNTILKTCEAPLQMKANGGIFLIDDFGRQRIDHKDLLNRWIVPLEKRHDYLLLPNGKKIQVPFDELIIFSTNLNPKDLVDDAFLRRIPYKIEVENPTEAQFRTVFRFQCAKYGIPYDDAMVTYLITKHYTGKRGFRVCQPRDILDQLINLAKFQTIDPRLDQKSLDIACRNYFAAMSCSMDSQG